MITKPNLTKARAAVFRLHQEYSVQKPSDIRVEDIAMDKSVFVVEGQIESAEARLIKDGSKGLVRVRADIPEPGRKRFAVSHELGHWQLHEHGAYICTPTDILDYQKSPREVEANTFAAEFLMPSFLFCPLCQNKAPTLELVDELKNSFNTTLTATALRLMDEIKENCMVVLSKDGVIQFCRRSEHCELPLFVELGSPVPQESAAFYCEPNPRNLPKSEKVPYHVWFDPAELESGDPDDLVVWEQSMRLGSYPTTLTILWVVEH